MPKASEQWEAPNETEQPSDGRTVRGLLLKIVLAMAATLSSGTAYSQSTERSPSVNEFALNFPETTELESIDHIHLDLRKNARHLLIHLRIMHWHDNFVQPYHIYQIQTCQQQWKEGLQSMIDHPRLRMNTVYAEGMLAYGTQRKYSRALDVESIIAAHAPQQIEGNEHHAPQRSNTETGDTLTNIPLNPHSLRDTYPILISKGADYDLHNERKIQLWGTEWWDTRKLADVAQKENWPDEDRYVFDLREQALLEIIAADRTKIAYVFYGGAHNWADNITEWNKEHPDEVFSLMEISPDCLIDDATKRRVRFEDPNLRPPPPPMANDESDPILRSGPHPFVLPPPPPLENLAEALR